MSIFKIQDDKLIELKKSTFVDEHINEFQDLQKYIVNSINIIDKSLLVISTEFSDWEDSRRRVDILCVDTEANLVVIELKRTVDGGHMELQAIRYSAMISNMTFEKAVKTYSTYLKKNRSDLNPEEDLLNFFGWDERLEEDFANEVKIILVSADFSKELTTSVLWLLEHNIDIKCVRIKPQKDDNKLYLDIQQIIPLPETTDYQVRLKEKNIEERKVRTENKRAKSIIKQLFELNLLKEGQKVILKPGVEQGVSKEKVTAIVVNDKQNCLMRENDERLYSFSRLRKILVEEFDLKDVKANWGFSIKNDWITEEGLELIELLNE